ncbi:hypothetical protein EVJ58_g7759 [Rhodofomes roseus]|uniref:FAD-binding FR-type domain-containing protein n=1 Tax=Rhodofomes roseus TaxID=34475 RepID=A0A4Y9Y3S8_9APHY|nr:hypothetical protein EVJ58_g7759 [Rhodofomes roseus]
MANPFADNGLEPGHLQRNKSERRRLQPLQRTATNGTTPATPYRPTGWMERFNVWMINEGGKRLFFIFFILLHILVILFGAFYYGTSDDLIGDRATFGVTYPIARGAALVLHVEVAFILLPVCRNFISLIRRTPLNHYIPFDKNITFHKSVGWGICFFSFVHIAAHMVNFTELAFADPLATTPGERFVVFLIANFTTGPGVTGWIMTAALSIMAWYAREKPRRANFERFWYSHHLFLVFFLNWQLHGMFCMIQPDRAPFCSWNTIGVFWRYWLVGGCIFTFERILREVRSRHRTYISKVIQHPSQVLELQIKKENTPTRAGQYIFLHCPEVSYFQWHPFTLTSAPEEDYISVHIRMVGDFTRALAEAVGADFGKEKGGDSGKGSGAVNPPVNRVLPRVMVDGPFGSASEDFLNYETVLLVGAGIGVTPFASYVPPWFLVRMNADGVLLLNSILKSIWYRMNNVSQSKPTRLSKVYFTWVIRDFGSAEWFHSLLQAIEEQDTQNRIEINIYLTAKIKEDDMNNIIVQDVGAEKDAITSLRAPTHYGRPNWDRVFGSIAEKNPETDVGVFFCGPAVLSKQLHISCNKYSTPNGTRFFFGKENF